MKRKNNGGATVLTDSVMIHASRPCAMADRYYFPIPTKAGCRTFAYNQKAPADVKLSGANGWISPLKLRRMDADSYGYVNCGPCDMQIRFDAPSAREDVEFTVILCMTVQVDDPGRFYSWYLEDFGSGGELTASRLLSMHLTAKAANLSRLYAPGQTALLEQMLSVYMAEMSELRAVGVRVVQSTWAVDSPVAGQSANGKEMPSIWE